MLPQDAAVLLVHADRVAQPLRAAAVGDERRIEEGRRGAGRAVAPRRVELVRVAAEAVLAGVKGVLEVVRVRRVGVRHDHLGEREAPRHRPRVERQRAQDGALARREADRELPPLPREQPVGAERKRRAVRLRSVQRRQRRPLAARGGEVHQRVDRWHRHARDVGKADHRRRRRPQVELEADALERARVEVVLVSLLHKEHRHRQPTLRVVVRRVPAGAPRIDAHVLGRDAARRARRDEWRVGHHKPLDQRVLVGRHAWLDARARLEIGSRAAW